MLRQIRERSWRASGSTARRAAGSSPRRRCSTWAAWRRSCAFSAFRSKRVTFVIDSNPNYTNVCITDCQFCAFYRKPGDKEA